MSTQLTKAAPKTSRRWRWLGALAAVLMTAGAVYGAYWAQVLRYHQSTDDAYVGGNVVQITPQISGTVVAIGADDTQFVKAGQPLVRLDPADARVALDQVWVDANFKEPQLAHMRIGQPVKLTADLYGGHVIYHGTVAGFGAGTGAAFSLLPAQNATGNWIKIVQRLPVRIALDPREIAAHRSVSIYRGHARRCLGWIAQCRRWAGAESGMFTTRRLAGPVALTGAARAAGTPAGTD